MRTVPPRVLARVILGAALLDRLRPGWHARLDPDALDLADARACVLALLHPRQGYHATLTALGLSHSGAVRHGFAAQASPLWGDVAAEYEQLTAAWRREVALRREPAGVAS